MAGQEDMPKGRGMRLCVNYHSTPGGLHKDHEEQIFCLWVSEREHRDPVSVPMIWAPMVLAVFAKEYPDAEIVCSYEGRPIGEAKVMGILEGIKASPSLVEA